MNVLRSGFNAFTSILSSSSSRNVRDITQGAFLTVTGAWIIKNHVFDSKRTRLLYLATGAGITCFGIYLIANRIFDFFSSKYRDLENGFCPESFYRAKENIMACPDAKVLWQEVQKMGDFTIRCNPPGSVPFGADTHCDIREIRISSDFKEVEQAFVFELSNLRQAAKIQEVQKHMCSISPEEYAHRITAIEYDSNLSLADIYKKCQGGNWPSRELPTPTLDAFLQHGKGSGHFNNYITNWYMACRKRFRV